jgi:hypothetical protein
VARALPAVWSNRFRRMSAYGTWRTFGEYRSMSAFGGKADIAISERMSAFDPKAEVGPSIFIMTQTKGFP